MYTTRNCIMELMYCIEQARHEYAIKKSTERILLKDRAYILYRLFKDVLLVDKSQDAIGDIISDLIRCEKTTMPKYMGDFNNPKEAPAQATKKRIKEIFQRLANNTEEQNLDKLIKLWRQDIMRN